MLRYLYGLGYKENHFLIYTNFLGIAQLFWVIPMIKRWGRIWYYVGIAGNMAFIILYVVTRFPDNPVNGRGGDVDDGLY